MIEKLKQIVKLDKKTIILPEGEDIRIIEAALNILKEEVANIIIIGEKHQIQNNLENISTKLNLDYNYYIENNTLKIVDIVTYDKKTELAESLYEIRKTKGMTIDEALEKINDNMYFSMMYLQKIEGDGLVAGAVRTTKDVLSPALQIIKKKKENNIVSTFFIMDLNEKLKEEGEKLLNDTYIFSDCALIEQPTSEELVEIALESEKSYNIIIKNVSGIDPKIAMLSYSTYNSANSKEIEKVQKATNILKLTKNNVDGELQLDAAISPKIAEKKAPNSNVAGKANILIFPNIEAGNIGYKLVQQFAKANAYGPLCQGLNKPINDLSRGSTVQDIIGIIVITCMQVRNYITV